MALAGRRRGENSPRGKTADRGSIGFIRKIGSTDLHLGPAMTRPALIKAIPAPVGCF
jgi:hypothetical protein